MSETVQATTEIDGNVIDIEIPKVDAKQIEADMLKAAENRVVDPAESAAMVFHMYKPELLKRLPKLSQKAMRRVLQLLIEYPLNDKKLAGTTQLEKEVFLLADAMLQSKFVMMMDVYKDGAEQLVAAQDEMLFGKDAKDLENVNQEGEE